MQITFTYPSGPFSASAVATLGPERTVKPPLDYTAYEATMKWTRNGNQWISGEYCISGSVMAGGYKNFVARCGDRLLCEVGTFAAAKDWCEHTEKKQTGDVAVVASHCFR